MIRSVILLLLAAALGCGSGVRRGGSGVVKRRGRNDIGPASGGSPAPSRSRGKPGASPKTRRLVGHGAPSSFGHRRGSPWRARGREKEGRRGDYMIKC